MKRNLIFFTLVILVASVVSAQRGPGRNQPVVPAGPQITISGSVVSFTAGAGEGMPTLLIQEPSKQTALVLGPFRVLQASKFSAAAGDRVEAVVISCAVCPSGYAVVSVRNLTNGSSVVLRDSSGAAVWQRPQPQRPNGRGPADGLGPVPALGPDMSRAETFSGTVKSFQGGPGAGQPMLVVTTSTGERTFIASPYRVLAASGLQLTPGLAVSLVAAPVVFADGDEWVVISLTDTSTGVQVTFRDPTTGTPGGHGCRN